MRALVIVLTLLGVSARAQEAPPPLPEPIVCDFVPGPVLVGSLVELVERLVYAGTPSPPPDGMAIVEVALAPDGSTAEHRVTWASDDALYEPTLRVAQAARFVWPDEIPLAERQRVHPFIVHFPPQPLFLEGASATGR